MRSLAAAVLVSTMLVASCMSSSGSTRSGRIGPRPAGVPAVAVMSRGPCFLAKPIVKALRHGKLEKYWKELEDPNEAPLRKIIEQDTLAEDALASLEQSVLTPHKWTFTRYTVQVLRVLKVQDLKQATALLRQEAYLRSTLRYVAWDGPPAFDTINSARVETIELFNFLEDTRTGGGPDAEQMQKSLDMFFGAAHSADPYSVGGYGCTEPDDAGTPDKENLTTSLTR